MITYNDFTEEMRQKVVDATQKSLKKLGVNVDVKFYSQEIRGSEHFRIESSPFNTYPVIYNAITVEGWGTLREMTDRDTEGFYHLEICLDYKFDYFSGASNGVELGKLSFRVIHREDMQRVTFLGLHI